jgi:hypothetical protein
MKDFSYFRIFFAPRATSCLRLPCPEIPTGKDEQVAIKSLAARWIVAAFMAMLATLALAAVTLAQPAEAAPRAATAVAVADDDDGGGSGGDDDGGRGDDDSARSGGSSASRSGDDDDGGGRSSGGGSSASRSSGDDDDTKGGVREVPSGGVDTGAGGTAASDGTQPGSGVGYLMAGGALLVGAVGALLRRITGNAAS